MGNGNDAGYGCALDMRSRFEAGNGPMSEYPRLRATCSAMVAMDRGGTNLPGKAT